MRLYFLELKRVLKTRMTWIVLSALLLASLLFGYLPVTFVYYTDVGADGGPVEVTGLPAVRYRRKAQDANAGELTPGKLKDVLAVYQRAVGTYGDLYGDDFPIEVYRDEIVPISPLLHMLRETYADPDTGIAADLMTLTSGDIDRFYDQTKQHLADVMRMEQEDYPKIQQAAAAMYSEVDTPFFFAPCYNADSMDYVTFCLLLLMLGAVILAAPTFSAEYQSQADDILRITKYGRVRLALTKLAAALTILLTFSVICVCALCAVSDALFGRACLSTSMQVAFSAVNLPNLTLGEMRLRIILAGFATVLAAVSCTMYISSKCRTTAASIISALLLCIAPILLGQFFSGNIASWVRCLLPSSGLALSSSYEYALLNFDFLRIGGTGFWSPNIMLLAAIVEIPVFLWLSVRAYCRHTA